MRGVEQNVGETKDWGTGVLINRVISCKDLVYIRTMHLFMQYHIFLHNMFKYNTEKFEQNLRPLTTVKLQSKGKKY